MVTEGYRNTPDETHIMVIETQDEGIVHNLVQPSSNEGKAWLPVGTKIGRIQEDDDDDDDDEEDIPWTWQAYLKGDDE
jgi:hypothetical protein